MRQYDAGNLPVGDVVIFKFRPLQTLHILGLPIQALSMLGFWSENLDCRQDMITPRL